MRPPGSGAGGLEGQGARDGSQGIKRQEQCDKNDSALEGKIEEGGGAVGQKKKRAHLSKTSRHEGEK